MESTVQKSCWGVTARAVLGFGAVLVIAEGRESGTVGLFDETGALVIAYLFGGI